MCERGTRASLSARVLEAFRDHPPIRSAAIHRPPNSTPMKNIAGTTNPVASTSTCTPQPTGTPAGERSSPVASMQASASPPPTASAVPEETSSDMRQATSAPKNTTMPSKISTTAHSRRVIVARDASVSPFGS